MDESPVPTVKLDRFSVNVTIVADTSSKDIHKPPKAYNVAFDNLKQMKTYLGALKDLRVIILHKTNVPIARDMFREKIIDMFAMCTCSDKKLTLSNLTHLYYHYVNVCPLPYHTLVNRELFSSVEKFVL